MQKKYYSKIILLDSPFNVDSNGTYSLCTDSDIDFEVFVVCSDTGESWGYLFLKSSLTFTSYIETSNECS
jgi:hypothetical protein